MKATVAIIAVLLLAAVVVSDPFGCSFRPAPDADEKILASAPADGEDEKEKSPEKTPPKPKNPSVIISTTLGDITVELFPDQAPITVKNFLQYTDDKFYDGTIFHRVIPEFMIQGGGFDVSMNKKVTGDEIRNEADNGLKNEIGTISMARTSKVDSATAQFFINTADNAMLDHKNETPAGFGYCVFGKVTDGMKVVDEIRNVPTQAIRGTQHQRAPVKPVIIKSVRRLHPKDESTSEKSEKSENFDNSGKKENKLPNNGGKVSN